MAYLLDPGVYRIRCLRTGRAYIGSSGVAVKGRLADHFKKLRQHAERCNRDMLQEFIEFGEAAFVGEVVFRGPPDSVLKKEQEILLASDPALLYNESRTASHRGPKDLKPTARKRMSESAVARCTPEFRKAKSLLMKQLRKSGRL